MPLWPIHKKNRIKRVILSTYQAASGAGAAAMDELEQSTRAFLDGRPFQPKVLPHPYAFNVFSHNTAIDPETGYNDEETKVIRETTQDLRGRQDRASARPASACRCCAPTASRSPSNARSRSREAEVRAILADAPGVKLVDDREKNYFPMPIDASGQGDVLVGRIRKDLSDPIGPFHLDVCRRRSALKGAALNAVQIAEYLI